MKNIQQNIKLALMMVAVLWLVHMANLAFPVDFRLYGLRPRRFDGLWGILLSPFLHLDFRHLIANSGALFILLSIALSYNRKLAIRALIFIILAGGGLVWLFGKSQTIHIGASGVIFGLIGFLMFIGLFRKEWKAFFISIIISFLYGGALLSLLVYVPGISWTGHLFGFISGVSAAGRAKK